MSESKFPPGWDEQRARRIVDHYDALTEDEQAAEDERAAIEQAGQTIISVPDELLPAIRTLIAEHQHP